MVKRNSRRIWAWFLLVPLALMTGCEEQLQDKRERISRPVKLHTVGMDSVPRVFKYPGQVSAVKQSDMAFEVSGRISEFAVIEGEFVRAGKVLARLEPDTFQAQRDRMRAEVSAARGDFERYQAAFKHHAVTKQQLDQARRGLRVAQAELKQAQKMLDDTVLVAPFDGRVAKKMVEDFANVQAKQTVLTLLSEEALEMKIHVPEADWARTKKVDAVSDIDFNEQIFVELSAYPNAELPAKISAFSSMADPVTRTFEVTVSFETPNVVSVSPGMTGRVLYREKSEQDRIAGGFAGTTFMIPESAILAEPDKSASVWVVDPKVGAVVRKAVSLGDATGSRIQVRKGLAKGDVIVTSGVQFLTEGDLVHLMEE